MLDRLDRLVKMHVVVYVVDLMYLLIGSTVSQSALPYHHMWLSLWRIVVSNDSLDY